MEGIDPRIAFAAKEEILRNILKTHSVILVEGWQGAGKTVTTLKAVKGMGDAFYYTEPLKAGLARSIQVHNDKVRILESPGSSPASGSHLLIFDDLKQLSSGTRDIIRDMVKTKAGNRKIIVITQVVLDAQYILEYMDVVVRFKQHTAEMLHSKLYDQGYQA